MKTHRRNGHRPPTGHGEGSNGVPTPCEALLLAALPAEAGWVLHHRVPRPEGQTYWIDLALLDIRTCHRG